MKHVVLLYRYIQDYITKHPECAKALEALPSIQLSNRVKIKVEYGDLTKTKCEAIVSSAAPDLGSGSKYINGCFIWP